MPGTVGGVARAPYGFVGDIVGVPAKGTLGDATIRRARERQAHMLQLIYRLGRLFAHKGDHILVAQVVAALDRVEGVPLGVVLLDVPQRRADTTLSRAGMRAGWV